jgi:hypothetical protein
MIRPKAISRLLAVTAAALALTGLGAGVAQAAAPAWQILAATGPTNLPPVTNEVQRVAVDASGGTFTLALEGQSTGALPFDAQPAAIEAALDSLPAVGGAGGDITVTGGPGNAGAENPYFVNFGGALAGHDVQELAADGSHLQGGGATTTVTTSVEGKETFGAGTLALNVTNVGGAEASAEPPLTASIGPLPAGFESGFGFGGGWLCFPAGEGALISCTFSSAVAPAESAFTLKLPLTVKGSVAAPTSTLPVTVSGGGAAPATDDVPLVVSSMPAPPGLAAFWGGAFDADGRPELRAGGHPYSAATAFWLNTDLAPDGFSILPAGAIRTADVGLPPGFIGDPFVTEKRCPQEALDDTPNPIEGHSPLCTLSASQVGTIIPAKGDYPAATIGIGPGNASLLMNDVPALGSAAQFTANISTFGHVSLFGSVRSDADFGVDVAGLNLSTQLKVFGSFANLEGFPSSASGKAFLRNPTDCLVQHEEAAAGGGPLATLQMNSWANPDPSAVEDEMTAVQPVVTGCGALTEAWLGHGPEPQSEEPSFTFQPSTSAGSSPTGATANLHVPQAGLTDPGRLATSDLKKTVVTLPQGLSVNPSAANGLASCSEAQVGYKGSGFPMPNPTRFDEAPVSCPEASRIGTVQIKSPLLEEEVGGTIYLAAQEENPFNSLLALYLVVENERFGLTLKLPGEVKPDPKTGQLTATFDDNPQLPFEDLTLNFRGGGPRSTLATPETCGHFESTGSLEPWSAENREALPIHEAGFSVGSGCASSDAARPFAPSFEAGTTSTQAGAYAPLVIKVARKDGEQELKSLDFTLPKGLVGKLAGIPYCPEPAIQEAEHKSGRAEQASASCPSASQIGTVDTAAGVGTEPIQVGGKVYLAGPYKGAPLSSVVVTPAVAGPFDLGDVVIRAPLFVDPETAEITAKSDPIPTILKGIPLKVRSVAITLDRPGFTLNPTSCNVMLATAQVTGSSGATASPSNRFQVGGCKQLKFKPKLKISLSGATKRTGLPALKAVVTYPKQGAYADIRRAQVNLPHSEFLEQNNLNKSCTRPVLLEGKCPKTTIYGKAKAWTPLLDKPLEGPVYLVGGYGYKLPALVAELNGQIRILLKGKVDSGPNKGIRNTFEAVPDAPVSRFVLEMKGGKKYGLLINSENLCKKQQRANVLFTAQNGLVDQTKPLIADQCGKKSGSKKKHPKSVGKNKH